MASTYKCIFNNEIVPIEKAFVAPTDLALLRGYGIFDFFRCKGLEPLFLEDYLHRFYSSADKMRLKVPVGRNELRRLISELISINGIENGGIRLVLTGGESPNGYFPGSPTFFALNEPINYPSKEQTTQGVKLITTEYLRPLPQIKSLNYLVGIHLLDKIQEQGATDVLYINNGLISEVTRSNFFVISKEGRLITAGDDVLQGITRKYVLEIAGKTVPIELRNPSMEELKNASEAFLTGTTKRILPVTRVDELIIGDGQPGNTTKELMIKFGEFEASF